MSTLPEVVELVRMNQGRQRRELDETRDALYKIQIEREQELL